MLNVTQTEVVMSKTVKRAMRVMMIGLVALLGANAEAHYYVAAGKYKYCSLHCAVNLKNVPNPSLWPAKVRCEATAALVEISCPNGRFLQVPVNVGLVGKGRIDQEDWTAYSDNPDLGKAHVEVKIPLASLLDSLLEIRPPVTCPNSDLILETNTQRRENPSDATSRYMRGSGCSPRPVFERG